MTPPEPPQESEPPAEEEGRRLATLLELAARRLHSQGHAERLFPAQWTALRYFAEAPPETRSAVGLAQFQRLAPGAVARTVRTLVTKDMLVRAGRTGTGRAERLDLTAKGRALLKSDPLAPVAAVFGTLEPTERAILERALGAAIEASTPPVRRPRS